MMNMGMDGTKWLIFNAAIDMFADSNYHNVSMRDIARRVGIKASSIYNHFLSKEELLTTIFDYFDYYLNYHIPNKDKLQQIVDSGLPPVDVLDAATIVFDPSLQTRMDKIIIIACKEMHATPVAEHLLYDSLVQVPSDVVGGVIDRMIERGNIRDLDREAFLLLYTSLCHTFALRQYTAHPVPQETYRRGLHLLCDLLDPADAPDPAWTTQ